MTPHSPRFGRVFFCFLFDVCLLRVCVLCEGHNSTSATFTPNGSSVRVSAEEMNDKLSVGFVEGYQPLKTVLIVNATHKSRFGDNSEKGVKNSSYSGWDAKDDESGREVEGEDGDDEDGEEDEVTFDGDNEEQKGESLNRGHKYELLAKAAVKVVSEVGKKLVPEEPFSDEDYGVEEDDYGYQKGYNVTDLDEASRVMDIYKQMYNFLIGVGESATKELLPVALQFGNTVPPEVLPSMLKFMNSALALHPWALKFLDACGKFPYGFVDGTVTEFGDFDECLDITVPDVQQPIYGQYCVVDFKLPLPPKPDLVRLDVPVFSWNGTQLQGSIFDHFGRYFHTMYVDSPRLGVCVPSHFKPQQMAQIVNNILRPFKVEVKIPEHQCTTRFKPIVLTTVQKVALTILIMISSTVISATLFDYCSYYRFTRTSHNKAVNVILSFSMIRNTQRLFSVPEPRFGETHLNCVHGMRVLTMFWIVINHTYLLGGFFLLWIYRRITKVREWPNRFAFQAIYNGWLTVETFFFLSGLIVTFCALPLLEKSKGRFNYLAFILHRIFRLIPAYVGALCLNMLLPHVIEGPVMLVKGDEFIVDPCKTNWWANLLFVNNWLQPQDICLYQSWYLSADTQLYLIAPLVIILLYRAPNKGLLLCWFFLVAGVFASGLVIYINKLPPSILTDSVEYSEQLRYLHWAYMPTYQHLAPYCIGMFVGYLLVRHPLLSVGHVSQALLWTILPMAATFCMVITAYWNRSIDNHPGLIGSSVYVALRSIAWSSAVGWVVFACSTGRAGLVSEFLSWKGFVPVSRLTFGISLTHLMPLYFKYFSVKQSQIWSDSLFMYNGVAIFCFSLLLSYLLYVTFEAPFINIEKVIFAKVLNDLQMSKPSTISSTLRSSLASKLQTEYGDAKIVELIGCDEHREHREDDPHEVTQGKKACDKAWDSSVHSKSFVFIERL